MDLHIFRVNAMNIKFSKLRCEPRRWLPCQYANNMKESLFGSPLVFNRGWLSQVLNGTGECELFPGCWWLWIGKSYLERSLLSAYHSNLLFLRGWSSKFKFHNHDRKKNILRRHNFLRETTPTDFYRSRRGAPFRFNNLPKPPGMRLKIQPLPNFVKKGSIAGSNLRAFGHIIYTVKYWNIVG